MARSRNLLHKSKLEKFKLWLESRGWIQEETKGYYEVLRMTKEGALLLVFKKAASTEHYTVEGTAYNQCKKWLRERKRKAQAAVKMLPLLVACGYIAHPIIQITCTGCP